MTLPEIANYRLTNQQLIDTKIKSTDEMVEWLNLTAPRVHQANAYMYRQLELDDKVFNRCDEIMIKILARGKPSDTGRNKHLTVILATLQDLSFANL